MSTTSQRIGSSGRPPNLVVQRRAIQVLQAKFACPDLSTQQIANHLRCSYGVARLYYRGKSKAVLTAGAKLTSLEIDPLAEAMAGL
jgi:hypothetical protein